MRVLYLSRIDDISGRYSFDNVMRGLLREALAADPDLSVVITVARGLDDSSFLDEVGAPGRVEVVGALPPKNERHLSYVSTEEIGALLSQAKVAVPYDVVVCGQPGLTPMYWNALANRYSQGRFQTTVPMVSHMMWTVTRELMKQTPAFYLGELDLVGEAMAAWYGPTVWESSMLMEEFVESVRRWLSPAGIRKVQESSIVIPNGIDVAGTVPTFERREARRREGDLPRVFWAGRLTDQKRWTETGELLSRMSWKHTVLATTMFDETSPQVEFWRREWPTVDLHAEVKRDRMYELMALGDVVPCLSKVESYGIAWLEMLAAGLLVVFQRESWCERMLPDWYPFFADSPEEVEAMCRVLLKSYPTGTAWTDWGPQIRQWVLDEHDMVLSGRAFGDLVRSVSAEAISEDRRMAHSSTGLLALAAAEEVFDGEPVPMEAIGRQMSEMSVSGRVFGKPGDMISVAYLRRTLQANGWRDVGGAKEVRMAPPVG